MIPLTLQEIAAATGGELFGERTGAPLREVITDSREVRAGCLFIALRGERFDAHDFLQQVAASGAGAVVVSRAECLAGLNVPAILVPDTRRALGALGRFARTRLSSRVIAIGGSNGKTTTKHLVGSVLASRFTGTQSPKSFNNDIGVPLTLLGAGERDDYVVLELGTNHPGELAPLSCMSSPDIAAITSIGAEHLEGFGDLSGVRQEELCLLDGLSPSGLCIANGDDEQLLTRARSRVRRVISFGFGDSNHLRIERVECSLEGITFAVSGCREPFALPLPGRHNAANSLVAIAIGREFGMTDAEIRAALAQCTRPEMRMQVTRLGAITLLNDAYNANPSSMRAALETISSAEVPGRRIAVLGEMRELGAASEQMHHEVGEMAAQSGLALLVAVGEATRHLIDGALAGGMSSHDVRWVPDAAAAAELLPPLLLERDTVLLKGSRGIRLERVAEAIAQHAALAPAQS